MHLRTLIQDMQNIFSQKASEKNLNLYLKIDEKVPIAVYIDEVRLRQILFNLIGNALKFTERGSVTLSCRAQVYPTEAGERVWLELIVEDTGIGIAKDQQKRIFEAFVQSDGQSTRKYGGTGLGLTITRRLTDNMGGILFLRSQVNQGTTFTLVFPDLIPSETVSFAEVDKGSNDHLNEVVPAHILVVDDIESNRKLIGGYFAGTHHTLSYAEDGEVALRLIQSNPPDLILLDLRMPHMDGWETAHYLKADPETQQIPIIILTASSNLEEERRLCQLCQGFWRKPISKQELIRELKKHLKLSDQIQPLSLVPRFSPGTDNEDTGIQIPELIRKLEGAEVNTWQALNQTLKLRELKEFTQQLTRWGEEHHCQLLLDYARELRHQLNNFDFNQIPQTIAEFPQLRKTLEVRE